MSLIDSPRLTARDRDRWATLARYDGALAARLPLGAMADRARAVITDFATAPCYASTSWGKDSTVVAHLAATSGTVLPLVYVRMRRWENPDCLAVRDRFLEAFGHLVDYCEYWVDGGPRWWEADVSDLKSGSHVGRQFAEAERQHGHRHISGVRAEESRMRAMAMGRWGEAGPHAARPIGRWSAVEVFAYLHAHDLPIHPAYAMSMGGAHDRRWLRVSPIGGITQAHKQRAAWEAAYYPELVPVSAGGAA